MGKTLGYFERRRETRFCEAGSNFEWKRETKFCEAGSYNLRTGEQIV